MEPVFGDMSCAISMAGSRYWLEVGEVMTEDVAVVTPDQPVVAAARQMSLLNISCVVVTEHDRVSGIVTETDLLKRAVTSDKNFQSLRVQEIMSSPVMTIPPTLSVLTAARLMEDNRYKRLIVVEKDRLVGIITQTDLVRVLTSYGMWKDVSAIMSPDVATVDDRVSVAEAARIMAQRDISCVIAMEDNRIVGMFTERDLMKRVIALKRDPNKITLQKIMSSPVISVPPSGSVLMAFKLMEKNKIRRLVVQDEEKLCGVLTQTDVFYAIKGKLQEEEQKNIRLLEESPNSICSTDLDGILLYVNPAFVRMMEGKHPEEFIGKPFLPDRHWCDPGQKRDVLDLFRSGQVAVRELALRTCFDHKVYVTLFTTYTKNINGQINGTMGLLDDITDKKELVSLRQMEDNLRHSEQMLRSTVESTADGIVVIDESGRISHWNRRFVRIWNFTEEELSHMDGPALLDRLAQNLKRPKKFHNILRQLGRWKQESLDTLRLKNGRYIESFTCPLHRDNRQSGRVWNFRDITWRKRAEDELILAQSEAMEACRVTEQVNRQLAEAIERANVMAQEAVAANRAKSEFLSNMSHEIRTPMNVILGFSDLLMTENSHDKQREYIQAIEESGRHLLSIIEDILDFSKIEAGRLKTELTEFVLDDFVVGIESLMKPLANRKKLVLRFRHPAPSGPIVSDPARLRQCMINLVGNAIKFTDTGYVEVRVQLISGGMSQSQLRVEVQDTGIGISAVQMQYLFEPFRQADGSTTRRFGGTGLGLAITRQLAELLGGTVSVTSEPGMGSTFCLQVPVRISQRSESRPISTPILPAHASPGHNTVAVESQKKAIRLKGSVLVVEDSATNQMLLRILLEQYGLRVSVASDGAEGIDKAQKEKFDLILMDIQMPRINGFDAVRTLRQNGIGTPIIALTAHAMKEDLDRSIEVGCNDYISKPIDRRQFKQLLVHFLEVVPLTPPCSIGHRF